MSEPLLTLRGHGGAVTCVACAWHGDGAISGACGGEVRLWDLEGHKKEGASRPSTGADDALTVWEGHQGRPVTRVAYFTPHVILSAGADGTVRLWDARRPPRAAAAILFFPRSLPVAEMMLAEGHGSDKGTAVVAASACGHVAAWDLRCISSSPGAGRAVAEAHHHDNTTRPRGPTALCRGVSSTSSVVTAGCDGIVREWDVAGGGCRPLNGSLLGAAPAAAPPTEAAVPDGSLHVGHAGAIMHADTFGHPPHRDDWAGAGGGQSAPDVVPRGVVTCSWDGLVQVRTVELRRGGAEEPTAALGDGGSTLVEI